MIENYTYGTNIEIIHQKEDMKCDNIIKQYGKWLTTWECYKRKHKKNMYWPQISDFPYVILITGGSGSGKKKHWLIR